MEKSGGTIIRWNSLLKFKYLSIENPGLLRDFFVFNRVQLKLLCKEN